MSINQTSLLAKLLATENISVQQQPNIKTAMFDLRNRVLMLPIWQGISRDLEDLLIVHETGHALDTPGAEEYKAATDKLAAKLFPNEKISDRLRSTIQGFINVIEDARIDKRQKRRYPGSRKNYLIGYKELVDRNFFGTADRDINSMNFIDRLNLYFKGGNIHYNITFTPEEKVFLKRVENAETFAEVEILSEEIYLYCKQKLEEQKEMEIDLVDEGESEGEGDDEFDNDDADWTDSDENDNEDSSSGSGQSEDEEEDGINNDSIGSEGGPACDLPNDVPVSHTDDTWQKKSEEIVKSDDSVFIYLNKPHIDYDRAIHDYKKVLSNWRNELVDVETWGKITHYDFNKSRAKLLEWKTQEKQSISFLVKEFEQRKAAELYAKINVAKTGVIDTNKLHTYKFSEDIFRRIATVPQGKNHGFVMFLDWSGSMTFTLKETLKQLFSLCLFCKQIGVPFEVYAFKNSHCDNPFSYLDKENVIAGGNVVLRNFLSSRMNTEEFNFAMTMLWLLATRSINSDSMGGTPLNEALMIAPKIVNDFTAKNKLEITNVIILTDGEADSSCGVKNETAPRVYKQTRRYFYVDPDTHKTYDYNPYGWGVASGNTKTWLRVLKDNTGCNLVGFFLYERAFKRLDYDFRVSNGNPEAYNKARKFWLDNKFYPIKSAGYDEYYIIDTGAMKQNKNELEIDNTGDKKMTTKKMISAFTKFAKKKTVNRVLLRQFSERIAGHSRKVS